MESSYLCGVLELMKYCYMKNYVALFGLLLLCACSDSTTDGYDTGDAQQLYNQVTGSYRGNVMVNNLPSTVQIVVGTDFTVKNLPTYPILNRIFTDGKELEAAMNSVEKVTFTTEMDQMTITDGYILMTTHPGDLQFTVTARDKSYQIVTTFQTRFYSNRLYGNLTVSMVATELYCDGVAYDLSQNGISYVIDSAVKD